MRSTDASRFARFVVAYETPGRYDAWPMPRRISLERALDESISRFVAQLVDIAMRASVQASTSKPAPARRVPPKTPTAKLARESRSAVASLSREAIEERLLVALRQAEAPLSLSALASAVGRARDLIEPTLYALVRSGRVHRLGKRKKAVYAVT